MIPTATVPRTTSTTTTRLSTRAWTTAIQNPTGIKEGDPHFGWKLGRFVVSGFTSRAGDDVPVFLKNSGDQVELSFQLNQSIDSLNGDDKRKISGDGNGYDEYFGIPKTDFGHGALITKHTDYQNASTEPIRQH